MFVCVCICVSIQHFFLAQIFTKIVGSNLMWQPGREGSFKENGY